MRIVVAPGGNALFKRDEPMTAQALHTNVRITAASLADLTCDRQIIAAHGTGPQVGLMALHAEALLIVTDVEAVFRNWGAPDQTPIGRIPPMRWRQGRLRMSRWGRRLPPPATSSGPEARLRAKAACRMRAPSSKDRRERRSDGTLHRQKNRPQVTGTPRLPRDTNLKQCGACSHSRRVADSLPVFLLPEAPASGNPLHPMCSPPRPAHRVDGTADTARPSNTQPRQDIR